MEKQLVNHFPLFLRKFDKSSAADLSNHSKFLFAPPLSFAAEISATWHSCREGVTGVRSGRAAGKGNGVFVQGEDKREGAYRRKIRMIESNAKCRYLKKLTRKGALRQVFICLRPPPFLQVRNRLLYTPAEYGLQNNSTALPSPSVLP
jgi:hypothetical protein